MLPKFLKFSFIANTQLKKLLFRLEDLIDADIVISSKQPHNLKLCTQLEENAFWMFREDDLLPFILIFISNFFVWIYDAKHNPLKNMPLNLWSLNVVVELYNWLSW